MPSLGSIAPSVVGGAIVPLAVYYLVRSHVGSDADALAIAGIPAAIWVIGQFMRRRRIDPIGAIVLFGFVVGLSTCFITASAGSCRPMDVDRVAVPSG